MQFLLASSKGNARAIMSLHLPAKTPTPRIRHGVGSTLVIGEDEKTRTSVERDLSELKEAEWKTNLPFVMGSMASSHKRLEALHSGKDRDSLSVSTVFLSFYVSSAGVSLISSSTKQFRGRIADRNKPLGHALVEEIVVKDGKVCIIDHQASRTIELQGVLEFDYSNYGVIPADRDPYKLK